jgi:CheY-like chemotaxis protein
VNGQHDRPAESRRILVVDDNQDAAESLAMLLEISGHRVATAHGGVAALDLANTFEPEVVLLDIGMPDIDGYEVCSRLRGLPRGDAMRVLALTGWGQEADRRKAREAGFDAHLTKPVDYETLAKVIAPRREESGTSAARA